MKKNITDKVKKHFFMHTSTVKEWWPLTRVHYYSNWITACVKEWLCDRCGTAEWIEKHNHVMLLSRVKMTLAGISVQYLLLSGFEVVIRGHLLQP